MNALPAGVLLFDAGIYIRFIREGRYSWLESDGRIFQRTILTAVVAAELYAGTRSLREKRALDDLCHAHNALGHFSSPSSTAWIETGVILRRARIALGRANFAHHFRDVLIAMEALHAMATLVTENIADFTRWKSLLAPSQKTLKLFNPS